MRRQTATVVASYDGGPAGSDPIRELDRVRLLTSAVGDGNERVPMGSTGTVVGIYAGGAAFEVEFSKPVDTLVTIEARSVLLVERSRD
ncbi:DUF4926 domain-containing protein [uncultured Methylobacterium sp.]|uniref:DUF4926 domain-containing protein n=1 Tax=uncultured Methylobacterium sp. TaxID=157278 RepID=UPI0035C98995